VHRGAAVTAVSRLYPKLRLISEFSHASPLCSRKQRSKRW
jgi:hypothetical protein